MSDSKALPLSATSCGLLVAITIPKAWEQPLPPLPSTLQAPALTHCPLRLSDQWQN